MATSRRLSAAVLGAADGLVSTSGVVAAALSVGGSHHSVGRLGLAAAAAGTVSMANAEFASEGKTDWGAVLAMGIGTLLGAAAPVIPLLFLPGILGIILVLVVALMVIVLVTVVRGKINGRSWQWNGVTSCVGLMLGVAVGLLAGSV